MRVRVVVAAVAIALLAGSSAAAQDPAECLSTLADPIAWAGLPLEQTAEILGCRQLEDGRWVATTVGDTRRFRRPAPMASAIQSQIDVARSLVLDDIRAMAADPRLTQLFVYDLNTQTVRYRGSYNTEETIPLTGQPLATPPDWAFFDLVHNAYQEAVLSYLLDPTHSDLASYVVWVTERRDSALLAMAATIPIIQADGIMTFYGYQMIPWPWQLADPYTIDSFLLWLIQMASSSGGGDPGAPAPVAPAVINMAVRITDEAGVLLSGACIKARDERGYVQTCDNGSADLHPGGGVIEVNVWAGMITVEIIQSPAGYEPAVSVQTAMLMTSGASMTFTFRRD